MSEIWPIGEYVEKGSESCQRAKVTELICRTARINYIQIEQKSLLSSFRKFWALSGMLFFSWALLPPNSMWNMLFSIGRKRVWRTHTHAHTRTPTHAHTHTCLHTHKLTHNCSHTLTWTHWEILVLRQVWKLKSRRTDSPNGSDEEHLPWIKNSPSWY